jgi:hypothetical protein
MDIATSQVWQLVICVWKGAKRVYLCNNELGKIHALYLLYAVERHAVQRWRGMQ